MSSSSSSSKAEMGGGGENNSSNVNNDKKNKKRAATSTPTSTLSPRCSSTTTTSSSHKKQKVRSTSATTATATTTTTPTTISNAQPPIFCWVTQGKTDHYAIIVDPLVLAVLAKARSENKEDGSRNNVTRSGTKRTCRAAGNNSNSNAQGQRTELSRLVSLSTTEMEIKWCSTKHKQKVLVSSVTLDVDPGHADTTTSTVLGSPEGRGIGGGSSKRPRRSSTAAAAMTLAASSTPSVLRGGRARGRERESPVQLSFKLTGSDHGDEDGTTTTGVTPSSVRRGRGRPPKQPPLPQTQPDVSPLVRGTDEVEDDDGGSGGKKTTTRTTSKTPPSSLSSAVGVIRRSREQPGKQCTTNNNNGSNSTGLEGSGGDAMIGGTGMGVRMGGSCGELGGLEVIGESRRQGGFVPKDRTTTTSTGTMKYNSTSSHGSSTRSGKRDDDDDHDHDSKEKEKAVLVDEDEIVRTTGNNINTNYVDHHTKGKAADKTAQQDSYATIAGPGTRGGDNSMGGVGMGARMGGSSGAPGGPEVRGGSDVPDGFVAKGSTATASTGTMDRTSTRSHGSFTRSGNRDDHGDDASKDEYNDDKVRSKEDNEDKLSCEDADDDNRTVAMSPVRDDSNVTAAGHNTTVAGEGHNNNNHIDNNTEGKTDTNDNDDDGAAAAAKEFESTFKSLTTLLSTATATAKGVGGEKEEEEVEAGRVRVAAYEFHYYVFQLLYMIGFLVHCRKYNDWMEPVTLLHILVFVMTSSVAIPDDTSTVTVHSSGNRKKQTRVKFSFSVVIRELLFLTFLGLVITTAVGRSPQIANAHRVMGFISFFCLVPPQGTRVLTQLHVFLVAVFQSSSSASPDTSVSGSSFSQTTQDGLNRTRIK